MRTSNYFKSGWRNLVRNKLFSVINIVGLAIGLAACILISLFVLDEISYDEQWSKSDRIFRLHSVSDMPGRPTFFMPLAPGPSKHALVKDYPEIISAARIRDFYPVAKIGDDLYSDPIAWADPELLDIFDFEEIAGDLAGAVQDNSSVVLSRERAVKYFGSVDAALGQIMHLSNGPVKRDFRVGAVYENLAHNTHLKLEAFVPVEEADFVTQPWNFDNWFSNNTYVYFLLGEGDDITSVNADMQAFVDRHYPTLPGGPDEGRPSAVISHEILPVGDIQLHSYGNLEMKAIGSIEMVRWYSAIAVIILTIAAINFTNLSTTRATQRSREVALRKVAGASKRQIMIQFLGESVIMTFIALLLALVLVELGMPAYNEVLGKELVMDYGASWVLPAFLLIAGVTGLLGGFYPALVISGFRPSKVLKANKAAETSGSTRFRTILVVAQFAASIGLMVATGVVYGQTLFARDSDPGFNKENLVMVWGAYRPEAREAQEAMMTEIANLPGVVSVTRSSSAPGHVNTNNSIVRHTGENGTENLLLGTRTLSASYADTYQITMLAGRFFRDTAADQLASEEDFARGKNGGAALLNRTALPRFGFQTPEDAVGKTVLFARGSDEDGNPVYDPVTIVGVIDDINIESVRRKVRPEIFLTSGSGDDYGVLTARFEGSPSVVADQIGEVWRRHVPDLPYRHEFVDVALADQYEAESAQGTLFTVFSGLAIFIASLGLFGLATFTAEKRTREIGVRKVLGASIADIVKLLVWQFSQPVLIANLIAWPLSWYFMSDWLSGFVYRIDSSLIGVFCLIAGAAAIAIAWATIAGNAIKVARLNPIHALRYE